MINPNSSLGGSFTAILTDSSSALIIESPRESREFELPGGKVEVGEDLWDAAVRETLEETGVDISDSNVIGEAQLVSRMSGSVTGLFVVRLTAQETEGIDFNFTSPESTRVLTTPLDVMATYPTVEEDLNAPQHTFRGHRVMAQTALGIVDGDLDPLFEDFLSGPFENEYLQSALRIYYPVSNNA